MEIKSMIRAAAFVVSCVLSVGFASAENNFEKETGVDAKGSADSTLTGRYEGSFIIGQTQQAFDEITFPTGPADPKEQGVLFSRKTARSRDAHALCIALGAVFAGGVRKLCRCLEEQGVQCCV
jgi:hypothetical protein